MPDIDPLALKPSSPSWHIGIRSQRISETAFVPGALLPPRRSWTEGYGLCVISVTPAQSGNLMSRLTVYDYDAAGDPIEFIEYLPGTGIECPKIERDLTPEEHRPVYEGASPYAIDWSKVGRAPLAREVAAGDVLPPRYENQPWNRRQLVTRLGMAYDGRLVLTLRDESSTRRNLFPAEAEVQFPRPAFTANTNLDPAGKAFARARAVAHVQTSYWLVHRETGQVFRVLKHPYGRGKWPKGVVEFAPLLKHRQGKPIAVRPPLDIHAQDTVEMEHIPAAEGDLRFGVVPAITPQEDLDFSLQWQAMNAGQPVTIPNGAQSP